MKRTLMNLALTTVFATPLAACAQSGGSQSGQSSPGASAQPQPGQPEWVVVTITPVEQRVMDEQRREALFRALDANGDGQVSMAEAGVNTQLLSAFQRLDRDSNRSIDRQEFARVHVNDGKASSQAQPPLSSGQSSAASGGATMAPGAGVPSPRIDERAIGVQPNLPPQPVR
jgi:hypothetical protein